MSRPWSATLVRLLERMLHVLLSPISVRPRSQHDNGSHVALPRCNLHSAVAESDQAVWKIGTLRGVDQSGKHRRPVLSGAKECAGELCRPYGTRAFVPLHPALPCRAFTSRRYAAGVLVVVAASLAFSGSSQAVSKAQSFWGAPTRRLKGRFSMVLPGLGSLLSLEEAVFGAITSILWLRDTRRLRGRICGRAFPL